MIESPKRGSRICIFCGVAPVTAEHTLPRWLTEHVPPRLLVRRTGTDHPENVWRERGVSHRVRAVCARCNNGWMSELEREARPHLVGLLKGTPCVLGAEAQTTVATWAFKTSCVMSTTRHPNLVSGDDIDHLWRHGKPPVDVEILAGSYEGGSQMWIDHRGLRFDVSGAGDYRLGDAYMTIIQLRALLLVVFCDISRRGRSLIDSSAFSFVPLWPALGDRAWPPRVPFTDRRLKVLMGEERPVGLTD